MNIIEQIKAEVERRIKENESWKDFHRSKGETTNFDDVKIVELQSILSFISTLESEKPVPKDLEEAADNHIGEVVDAAGHPGWEWETRDVKDAFIAGYNLCKEQMLKEAVECIVEDWNQEPRPEITIPLNPEEFSNGDRVHIIIVKEDSHE